MEVKCPSKEKTTKLYIKDNILSEKCKVQINLQMFCTGIQKGLFCVASPDFETSRNVRILHVEFDDEYIKNIIACATENWKEFVYPKLYKSLE